MGPRGMPARPFARVDESAMQAKLQELKVAMAREKVARDTARGVMEAGGGRMWRSSAPRPRELRLRPRQWRPKVRFEFVEWVPLLDRFEHVDGMRRPVTA